MSSYKQMLRDRMPQMMDLALTYCKAKNRWINYVYDSVIRKYSKEKRGDVVKILVGQKPQYKRKDIYDHMRYVELKPVTKEQVNNIPRSELYMTFRHTINFEKLSIEDPDMYEYWNNVADWVDWFSTMYFKVRDTYEHSKRWKLSDNEIKVILIDKYGIDGRAVDYLIKTF